MRRIDSELGAENHYTVPVWLGILEPGSYEIEFSSFDSFNLPFSDLAIELTDHESFNHRILNDVALERSKVYSRVVLRT